MKNTADVLRKTGAGDLDIEINTASLLKYLPEKLANFDPEIFDAVNGSEFIISSNDIAGELKRFGLSELSDLENLFTEDFRLLYNEYVGKITIYPTSYLGLLRSLMILEDIDRYFQKAWNNSWDNTDLLSVELYSKKYGSQKVNEILNKYFICTEDY